MSATSMMRLVSPPMLVRLMTKSPCPVLPFCFTMVGMLRRSVSSKPACWQRASTASRMVSWKSSVAPITSEDEIKPWPSGAHQLNLHRLELDDCQYPASPDHPILQKDHACSNQDVTKSPDVYAGSSLLNQSSIVLRWVSQWPAWPTPTKKNKSFVLMAKPGVYLNVRRRSDKGRRRANPTSHSLSPG